MLTSQRIVDVVLKAFHAAAASQGCTKYLNPQKSRGIANECFSVTSHLVREEKTRTGIMLQVGVTMRYAIHIIYVLSLSDICVETIAGGSGAGPSWHGTDGVHTHITNTRIGDVEILERRYPVMIHQFGLRHGSAGLGKWHGGEGVIRELEFLEPMQVSILSEVHVFSFLFLNMPPHHPLSHAIYFSDVQDNHMDWKVGDLVH